LVEERKTACDSMAFIKGCKNPWELSILIRGIMEGVIDEEE